MIIKSLTLISSFDLDNKLIIEWMQNLPGFLFSECHYIYSYIVRYFPQEVPEWTCHYRRYVPIFRLQTRQRIYAWIHIKRTPGLLSLPLEILDAILKCCDNFYDALALAMTSKMLYMLGFAYIQQQVIQLAAPCVGSRLVCLGGTNLDDHPPPIGITQSDLDQGREYWKTKWQEGLTKEPWHHYLHFLDRTSREIDPDFYRRVPNPYIIMRHTWKMFSSCAEDSLWFTSLEKILHVKAPFRSEEIILCNLTKREYVDGTRAMEMVEQEELVPNMGYLLGAILRSRICWSEWSGFGYDYKGDIHQGVWAADRFEVTSRDRLQEIEPVAGAMSVRGEWKDVTEEAVEQIESLYKFIYEK